MRDALLLLLGLVAGVLTGVMVLFVFCETIGRPLYRLVELAVRDYRYRRADRHARELGWADQKAMTDWRKEYERRYARLRAEARDG